MSGISRIVTPLICRFSALPAREQRALKMLLAFLLLVFLWKCVWLPVQAVRDSNKEAYAAAFSDFQWMQEHAQEAKSAPAQTAAKSPADGSSLLTLATDTAQMYKIEISHAEPAEDGSLHLSLESAAFSHLLPWLEAMQREHAIKTSQIFIERQTDKPGYVSASLTLQVH